MSRLLLPLDKGISTFQKWYAKDQGVYANRSDYKGVFIRDFSDGIS